MRFIRLLVGWLLLLTAAYLWWSYDKTPLPNPMRDEILLGSRGLAAVANWAAGCLAGVVAIALLGFSDGDEE
jgi:uncharacterized membrane protein YfcA